MPIAEYPLKKTGISYSGYFQERLAAHYNHVPWPEWKKSSKSAKAAYIAYMVDHVTMLNVIDDRRIKEQQRSGNKPVGNVRKRGGK